MGAPKKDKIQEKDLHGFKHFKLLLPVLEKLHDHRCERDRGQNRQLHYDQYIALLLLYFFNPIVTSLRGLQQASELKKVQRILGCPRASLGSLSEASHVFDADLLLELIEELSEQLSPIHPNSSFDDIKKIITLVDGSFLRALPSITEAMWRENTGQTGFKLHTHFELLKGVPVKINVTHANDGERANLQANLQAGRLYVMDRGYQKFELFREIIDLKSSFVCRLRDNSKYEVIEERELSAAAQSANIVRDAVVRFTGERAIEADLPPLRLVEIKCQPHRRSSKTGRGGPQQGEVLFIGTDMLDVPAEIIGLLYAERWAIEIFFRFFKHMLGCRHLLSHATNGIEIQTYVAIIACMLIALWTGKKPTLRTYEMICFYFSGLADLEELLAHIAKLQPQAA
jgi:hypothetical protein